MTEAAKPRLSVSVRELVEFVLRSGDLGGGRDFVSSTRALEGTRGHQRVQKSRPAGYQTEVSLKHDLESDDLILTVRGRIDGLLHDGDKVCLEEIKTIQGAWEGQAHPLHWAQGKIYAHIYAALHQLSEVEVLLTYLELDSNRITEFRETFAAPVLQQFFDETLAVYLEWARRYLEWMRHRDASIAALNFPFAQYRAGQRDFSVAVYRALSKGSRLFAEAPTGIGKTMSVLFPAMKVLGEGKLEKLFYLTAKTSGRAIAEKALADMRAAGLHCRSVTLTAREKVCVYNGQPCDVVSCPLAVGYYDRIKPAVLDALQSEALTRAALEDIAQRHRVCPFELALDVSLWVDVIIGDYNHVFDPQAYLKRYFLEEGGDYGFLIDEAHNLLERARDMYSAELRKRDVLDLRRAVKSTLPGCARALGRVNSALLALARESSESSESDGDGLELLAAVTPSRPATNQQVFKELPEGLEQVLGAFLKEAESWLMRNEPTEFREAMLDLYFQVYSFVRTAELYDERFRTIVDAGREFRVRLYCVDPSALILQALERGRSAVFFSATLAPIEFFRDSYGGDPTDRTLRLRSPFPPEHLLLLVHDRIATTYRARESSADNVAASIEALVGARQGNYLVYFPSYQYLNHVVELFAARAPSVQLRVQLPSMSDAEREEFIASFHVEHTQTLVGFAVMGGVFGEGIDLVGDKLVGVVVVGVGLPQLCLERDLIRDFYNERNHLGFEFAYQFPGMNRVLQAAGRVIRSESDRGIVLLIDQRFGNAGYRRLFPEWWRPQVVRYPESIRTAATAFWQIP